jgi:PAS domain S-box-containing protein
MSHRRVARGRNVDFSTGRTQALDLEFMKCPVRILHLEDDATDAELMRSALAQGGVAGDICRVAGESEFIAALDTGGFDLILADYYLPSFDGLTALTLARQKLPGVPFLFLSGFLGEEVALESLKQGATDYVFKHNLKRLSPAVHRALQEAQHRQERLAAEAALQESEVTLRSFFNTAPFMMGIVELLPDDILHLSDNAATAHFFDTTPEDMKGRRASELGAPVRAIQSWLRFYHEAERSERPVRFEYPHPRGERIHHLSVTVSPLPGAPGPARRFCYVAEDITDKKLLEQQFLRAQRLESIGTLASGVAHDLNNVLAPILVSLKVFRTKLTSAEDAELLDNLEASARRGAEITRQVLTFARGADGVRHSIQINPLLGDLERMMRDTFPRSIGVTIEVAGNLWRVTGDTTQIYQVLMNLCLNARDAMPHGGRLILRAENQPLGETDSRRHAEAKPGNYVALTVIDSGSGISPELLPKVFDPFFTTKEIGKGTGLGLSTALTIVRSHGGFFNVCSKVGHGTHVTVYLPAETEAIRASRDKAQEPVPRGRGELILVVDDEVPVRQAVKAVLLNQGYAVLTASDGREALALFERQRSEIRLVVTDVMMPGMDGSALIRALRQLDSHIGIIAMSGLLEGQLAPLAKGRDRIIFLQKPFAPEELLSAIHPMLTPPAGR